MSEFSPATSRVEPTALIAVGLAVISGQIVVMILPVMWQSTERANSRRSSVGGLIRSHVAGGPSFSHRKRSVMHRSPEGLKEVLLGPFPY
jgi:hypothetical protein